MAKKKTGGYYTNAEKTAIVSKYVIIEGKLPANFIASDNVDDKVLRISADGTEIEVVAVSMRDVMRRKK